MDAVLAATAKVTGVPVAEIAQIGRKGRIGNVPRRIALLAAWKLGVDRADIGAALNVVGQAAVDNARRVPLDGTVSARISEVIAIVEGKAIDRPAAQVVEAAKTERAALSPMLGPCVVRPCLTGDHTNSARDLRRKGWSCSGIARFFGVTEDEVRGALGEPLPERKRVMA